MNNRFNQSLQRRRRQTQCFLSLSSNDSSLSTSSFPVILKKPLPLSVSDCEGEYRGPGYSTVERISATFQGSEFILGDKAAAEYFSDATALLGRIILEMKKLWGRKRPYVTVEPLNMLFYAKHRWNSACIAVCLLPFYCTLNKLENCLWFVYF